MTPEMIAGLAMSTAEEPSSEAPEEPIPPSGLSQTQVNSQNPSQPPSSTDPFSISKNRINGDVRPNLGNSALFEKLNGSRVTVTPITTGGVLDPQVIDTPTGAGRDSTTEILLGKDAGGVISAVSNPTEPPLAPMRKARTLQGLGMDFSVDAPPKMRSNTVRPKSKSKNESEDTETTIATRLALNTGIGERKRTVSGQIAQSTSTNSTSTLAANSIDPMAPQRRSVRLFNQIRPQSGKFSSSTGSLGAKEGRELKKAKAPGTKGRSANTFTVGRVVSGNRKHGEPMDIDAKEQRPLSRAHSNIPPKKAEDSEKVKEYHGLQWLLELFTKLGSGYFCLSHYRCQEALQIFNSVTPSQRETPWVLAQIGRALYEQASYAEAEKYFTRIKTIAPSRLEDMEVYSTILWHLKNEIDLAFLAHEIIDIDRDSPQAWCAVGNSFSLQRDHDQALKCFKRATQLDPKFAYAFTLQGREHTANEEYDKALAAYRSSIAAENRHYNAWYGLGEVFEKQGKYEFAEQHYRTAATINPTNAVLVCCIGVVLEKMKNPRAALVQYTRSCELAPKSTLSRFKKARVLVTLGEPQKALEDLKMLKDIVPDEANVHFLLGRVYKILRQKGSAIRHFTTALNLDPKVCTPVVSLSIFLKATMLDTNHGDAGVPLY